MNLQTHSVSYVNVSDLLVETANHFDLSEEDLSNEFYENASDVSFGDASVTLIKNEDFIGIIALTEILSEGEMKELAALIPENVYINMEE
jgi:hypothetical protein